MIGFPGHPADSGVGESVGSCNLVGKESTYFTRSLTQSWYPVSIEKLLQYYRILYCFFLS
jgi:hypothetical protein